MIMRRVARGPIMAITDHSQHTLDNRWEVQPLPRAGGGTDQALAERSRANARRRMGQRGVASTARRAQTRSMLRTGS